MTTPRLESVGNRTGGERVGVPEKPCMSEIQQQLSALFRKSERKRMEDIVNATSMKAAHMG